jgi:hypothetical protein
MLVVKQGFTTDSGFDQRGPPAWFIGNSKINFPLINLWVSLYTLK